MPANRYRGRQADARSWPLLVVSIINVCCVGFIAFHFTIHADEPESGKTIRVEVKQPLGNIGFGPVSSDVLMIASHVQPAPFVEETSSITDPVMIEAEPIATENRCTSATG